MKEQPPRKHVNKYVRLMLIVLLVICIGFFALTILESFFHFGIIPVK